MNKTIVSNEKILRSYRETKSAYETARRLGISHWVVYRRMKKFAVKPFKITRPSKEKLERLYFQEKKSSDAIAPLFGVRPRTIREWMNDYGIELLGAAHLRKGISAHWCLGLTRSPETNEKNAAWHRGKRPSNYGKGRVRFACEICGTEVFDKPYRRKHTCSKECRNALLHEFRGEKSWHYLGGDCAAKQRQRCWAQCIEWRTKVLCRCQYTCSVCFKCSKQGMTAHHLYTWNDYPELRFDPENGIALCWPCHRRFHTEVSSHHTTPDDFWNWLRKLIG